MTENIVDTGKLLRQFAAENAELAEKSRPRFNPESYHVVKPERLARPPSYKKGGRVKRSGLALVHKGERVLSRGARILGTKARRNKTRRKPKR